MYGWFPVKLKTYVGETIFYNKDRSIDELVNMVYKFFLFKIMSFQLRVLLIKTKKSIESLIDKYQHRPGNIWYAVMERFGIAKTSKYE